MGRTVTPRYVVDVTFASPRWGPSTMVWDGRATDKLLAAWVDRFNASMLPGGANAHLGPDTVAYARIRFNRPGARATIADWPATMSDF